MVIKLQSILSPDFYHGVGHGEWCGVFFWRWDQKETEGKWQDPDIQTFDQTRPDQTNNRTIRLQLQDWLVLKIHEQKEDTTLLNFCLAPSSSVMLQGMGGSYPLQTQNWVQNWVALHEQDISRFLADYRLLLCTAWNTTNFRHYHHYYQCACCTRTDCSTHGLT